MTTTNLPIELPLLICCHDEDDLLPGSGKHFVPSGFGTATIPGPQGLPNPKELKFPEVVSRSVLCMIGFGLFMTYGASQHVNKPYDSGKFR